jgi:hypothetical protein
MRHNAIGLATLITVTIGSAAMTPAVAGGSPWAKDEAESPDGAEHVKVYLTEDAALAEAFDDADSVWVERWTPTPEERTQLERRLGWRLEEDHFDIYCGSRRGDADGWAVILEQVGLYKPITFMVKIDPRGKVDGTWIMTYRESRGGEVRRQRFLRQYRGKDLDSHIRLNRDITGITGATLSVRAMNAGVKRALHVVNMRYVQSSPPPANVAVTGSESTP